MPSIGRIRIGDKIFSSRNGERSGGIMRDSPRSKVIFLDYSSFLLILIKNLSSNTYGQTLGLHGVPESMHRPLRAREQQSKLLSPKSTRKETEKIYMHGR